MAHNSVTVLILLILIAVQCDAEVHTDMHPSFRPGRRIGCGKTEHFLVYALYFFLIVYFLCFITFCRMFCLGFFVCWFVFVNLPCYNLKRHTKSSIILHVRTDPTLYPRQAVMDDEHGLNITRLVHVYIDKSNQYFFSLQNYFAILWKRQKFTVFQLSVCREFLNGII